MLTVLPKACRPANCGASRPAHSAAWYSAKVSSVKKSLTRCCPTISKKTDGDRSGTGVSAALCSCIICRSDRMPDRKVRSKVPSRVLSNVRSKYLINCPIEIEGLIECAIKGSIQGSIKCSIECSIECSTQLGAEFRTGLFRSTCYGFFATVGVRVCICVCACVCVDTGTDMHVRMCI